MKKNKVLGTGFAILIALSGTFGLAACSDGNSDSPAASSQEASNIDVAPDLQKAKQAVDDALKEDPKWKQIMLASDVDQPTVKYGLLVVPFAPSEASKRVQNTVTITDGKYTIDAESAADGKKWQIDQDGKITEVK